MPAEIRDEDFLERAAVFGLVGQGHGADMAVRPVGEDGADGELLGAGFGLGGAVQLEHVRVDGLREHGRGFFLAGAAQDHHEEALGLGAEVAADVLFEVAVVGRFVGVLDGVHVGVGAADEDVVEPGFAGAGAFERLVQSVDVFLEGAAEDGKQAVF